MVSRSSVCVQDGDTQVIGDPLDHTFHQHNAGETPGKPYERP
jgi:hypothetical protein